MDKQPAKNIILVIIALASFLMPMMSSSINVALPAIGKEFNMDAVLLNWISTAFLLSAAIFLVPIGRIGDIFGRKKIFIIGLIVYTISSFLSAISFNSIFLLAARVLQGFGSSMIFGTSMAIVISFFEPHERGKVIGITVGAVYLGLTMGPPLGGFLTQHLGWRSLFWFNVPLGLLILTTIVTQMKQEWAEAKGEKFDLAGSLIFAFTLVCLIYGFSKISKPIGIWLESAGIAGLIAFIIWELRNPYPVLNIKMFTGNAHFTYSNLAALINYMATFAVTFLMSLFLQYIKGYSPQGAGFVLMVQPAVMALVAPFSGRFSDKIEPGLLASIGMALTGLGLFLLIFVSANTSLIYIISVLILLGFGFGLFSSPNTNAVMSSVEKRHLGIASGVLATMRVIGQMFSMGIAMLVIAIFIGNVRITPQYYPQFITSVHSAFIIFTILCVIGVYASLKRGKANQMTVEN